MSCIPLSRVCMSSLASLSTHQTVQGTRSQRHMQMQRFIKLCRAQDHNDTLRCSVVSKQYSEHALQSNTWGKTAHGIILASHDMVVFVVACVKSPWPALGQAYHRRGRWHPRQPPALLGSSRRPPYRIPCTQPVPSTAHVVMMILAPRATAALCSANSSHMQLRGKLGTFCCSCHTTQPYRRV